MSNAKCHSHRFTENDINVVHQAVNRRQIGRKSKKWDFVNSRTAQKWQQHLSEYLWFCWNQFCFRSFAMLRFHSLKILPKAIVCECEESTFTGDITISAGCIVHPRVTIIAEAGPIVIGENCLIEEYTTIINRTMNVLTIGSNNVFEVGCTIEAAKVGEKNVFECKCIVSSGITVTNNCIIGAGCHLKGEQTLLENTIVHGRSCSEREILEKSGVCNVPATGFKVHSTQFTCFDSFIYFQSHSLQLTFLRKLLPNYHLLRKPLDAKRMKTPIWWCGWWNYESFKNKFK